MLKKLAFILGFGTVMWLLQIVLLVCDLSLPAAITPLLALGYPVICFIYGFWSYSTLGYWSVLVSAAALAVLFAPMLLPVSILFTAYYAALTWFGGWIRKKTSKL